jgi:hypothetical protein
MTRCWRLHRLLRTEGKTQEQLQALIDARPPELSCTWNLGVADFYPSTSGKAAVARYLMQRHGAAAADCVFLCDDDNDLELAALVGKAFVPSIGSVRRSWGWVGWRWSCRCASVPHWATTGQALQPAVRSCTDDSHALGGTGKALLLSIGEGGLCVSCIILVCGRPHGLAQLT